MPWTISCPPAPQVVHHRKRRTARFNRLLRFRFSDLWRARHRGCSFITDSEEGHTMLMVLLRVRTTAESAMESAPWLSERALKALRKAGRKIPWSRIGDLLKLTDKERTAHKLWYWAPIDLPWEEVRRRQRRRTMEKERERRRKQRAKHRELRDMLSNSNDRKDAIIRMLAGADAPPARRGIQPPPPTPPSGSAWIGGWTAVSALVERAQTIAAFRRPDGWSVRRDSLRRLVHRTLRRLQEQGEIEIEMGWGKRGQVAFARLRAPRADASADGRSVGDTGEWAPHADGFCHRDSVTGDAKGETADRSTASTEKRASEGASAWVIDPADALRDAPAAPASSATQGGVAAASEHSVRTERKGLSEGELDALSSLSPAASERMH
jgi:hypothetical protein